MMDEQLPPSKLGTKTYWEDAYDLELSNFVCDGDEGDVWFGEGITRKMVNWIDKNVSRDEPILDLGTGNGITLIHLHKKGFKSLKGVDYSEKAVQLARLVSEKHQAEEIAFEQLDILSNEVPENQEYSVILDKGTYDAICLNPQQPLIECKTKYQSFIIKNLRSGGYFLITSCNWTREELMNQFVSDEDAKFLEFVDEIPTVSMTFGGKTGNNVTSLIFRRL